MEPQTESQPQEELWTTIPSRRKRHTSNPQPSAHPHPHPPSNSPLLSARDIIPATLAADFSHKLPLWRRSSSRRALHTLLSRVRPSSGWGLHTAICLATGSFSSVNLTWRQKAMWQLVLFVDLVGMLFPDWEDGKGGAGEGVRGDGGEEEDGRRVVTVMAQEPRYTDVDRGFLRGRGIVVVEADEGGNALGGAGIRMGRGEGEGEGRGGCFVYEPFMALTMEQFRVLVEADVGLYLGSWLPAKIGKGSREGEQKEETGLVGEFMMGREMCYVSRFEENLTVFEGMALIWREEGD